MLLFAESSGLSLNDQILFSIMMLLEFGIWSAWFVVLGNYLSTLKFSRAEIGRIYATMALGAIISPMFVGTVADRFLSSQHVMGGLHLIGAALLLAMAKTKTPRAFYWTTLAYAIVYNPTLPLSNAVIFATDPAATNFPEIRVFGTIGWIAAGLSLRLFIKPGQQVNNSPLLLAAALSVILGIFSFFLPDSPPKASGTGAEAESVMGVHLKLDKRGEGYTEAPAIVIVGGEGTDASAEAKVKDGKITEVEVKPGRGYTSPPKIEIRGTGKGAEIVASLQLVEVIVKKGGSDYKATKIPFVVAKGAEPGKKAAELGGGAVVESELKDGAIVSIKVAAGGSGYQEPPNLVFPQPGIPFLQALALFQDPSIAVFLVMSFLITIALAFYYSFTPIYLERGVKVRPENVGPLMTIGQWVEIIFMLSLNFFLRELGMKTVLLIGMAAWGLRYAIFSANSPMPLIIVAIGLHGICFDFFLAAGQIHMSQAAPPEITASAQALLGVLTYGLGMYLGTEAAGWLNHRLTRETVDPQTGQTVQETNWRLFWLIPCVAIVVCMIPFALLF